MEYKLTCKYCNNEFITYFKDIKYCSKECRKNHNIMLNYEARICPQCGKKFIVKKSSLKKYCCKECGFKSRVTLVKKICACCGKEFSVIKTRQTSAKYCSKECFNIGKKAKANTICIQCGKPIYRKLSQRLKHKHGDFCSYECLNIWKQTAYSGRGNHQYGLKGTLNASYKGDEIQSKNIKQIDDLIYCPNHPRASKAGRIRKYIVLVEQNYHLFDKKYFYFDGENYYLKKGVVVHHIDQNHNNNVIENLMPLTISEHTLIHQKLGTFNFLSRDKLGRFYNKTAVLKQGELLETPEVDNQQPSLNSNILEGSTTNSRVQTDNAEDGNANTSALPININGEDIV